MFKEALGYSDTNQFRDVNQYEITQRLFEQLGLSEEVENRTPTPGINIDHLAMMESIQALTSELNGKSLNVAILGLSTPQGPKDFERLLKALGTTWVSTVIIDLSNGIFEAISQTGLDEVKCFQRDARNTGLPNESQDLILRDHLGNCCPPEIDRAINREVARILKPDGIAIVNITTSENLFQSPGRKIVRFNELRSLDWLHEQIFGFLRTEIYDLEDLKRLFPGPTNQMIEQLRGAILEIEPRDSFVVFGEDPQGHGEWFRPLDDHLATWGADGFEVIGIKSRVGWDSHEPPLRCRRHNVVLRKITGGKYERQ